MGRVPRLAASAAALASLLAIGAAASHPAPPSSRAGGARAPPAHPTGGGLSYAGGARLARGGGCVALLPRPLRGLAPTLCLRGAGAVVEAEGPGERESSSSSEEKPLSSDSMFAGCPSHELEYDGEIEQGPWEDAADDIQDFPDPRPPEDIPPFQVTPEAPDDDDSGFVRASIGGLGGEMQLDSTSNDLQDLGGLFPAPGEPSRNLTTADQHPSAYSLNQFLDVLAHAAHAADADRPAAVVLSHGQSVDSVRDMYRCRHIDFGELSDTELVAKAKELPADVRFRLYGPLPIGDDTRMEQLTDVASLWCVASLRGERDAEDLDNFCRSAGRKRRLRVMVQVATVMAACGFVPGVSKEECVKTAKYVQEHCKRLEFVGVMGLSGGGSELLSRHAVITVMETRKALARELRMPISDVLVSVGQSGDYKMALPHGVDEVRVAEVVYGKRRTAAFDWKAAYMR